MLIRCGCLKQASAYSLFEVFHVRLLDLGAYSNIYGMRIVKYCLPNYEVRCLEINLGFLIELFFYMTKMLRQNFKYLKNKKSFQGGIIISKGL